ncbi:hypothetical protein BDV32DRAFT_152923 [Aspergillus pseudonomiae]|nr:hypothetical protein BDV32DRAFT_152923 [Aspergillus pseudonomiae]
MTKDLDIAHQVNDAILGSVKLRQLDQLLFEGLEVYGTKSLDQRNVKHLLHRFGKEGCRRMDPLTWIPAELSPSELQQLLALNSLHGLTRADPKEIKLQQNWKLRCLQGKHRVAAANQWLDYSDIWWNFILYDSTKLTAESRRKLREADSSSREFGDGEIFRNIRFYQKRGDGEAAGEWLARWTPTKCRDFYQIYKEKAGQEDHGYNNLRDGLDALLSFPALWRSWHMGTHLSSLNCPEELADYLYKIFTAWNRLTCHQPGFLDPDTVDYLQGRCPSLSEQDRCHICDIFDQNLAFPRVMDPQIRLRLRQAALEFPGIIPSLKLFHEDTKYLKPIVYVVKKLLPSNYKGTIRQAMRRYYIRPPDQKFPTQVSDNDFQYIEHTESDFGFWSAYCQIFLFAMRHFYGLSDVRPLGHSRYSKPRQIPDHQELWASFKALVRKVGFVLPGNKIQPSSTERPPEFQAIHSLLTRLRPPALFEYEQSFLLDWSKRVTDALLQITRKNACIAPRPSLTTDTREAWSLDKRCGMTDMSSFLWDQKYLFFQNIYFLTTEGYGENLSTFAVKRNMFTSFFPVYSGGIDKARDYTGQEPASVGSEQCQGPSTQNTVPVPPFEDAMMHDEPSVTATVSQGSSTQGTIPPPVEDAAMHDRPSVTATVGQVSQELHQIERNLKPPSPLFGTTPAEQLDKTTMDPQSHNGSSAIKIQRPDLCVCDMDITPGAFVAHLRDSEEEYPYIALLDVSERKLYCLPPSNVDRFPQLLREWGNVWFAKVDRTMQKASMLKSLTAEQVMTTIRQSTSLIFFGRDGIFRSDLLLPDVDMCVRDTIDLPYYNDSLGQWVMESQRGEIL